MIEVCEQWDLEDLAQLEDADMDRLLDEGWERGHVLRPEDMGKRRKATTVKGSPLVDAFSLSRVELASVVGAAIGAGLAAFIVFARAAK